jgi:hypothetical protein
MPRVSAVLPSGRKTDASIAPMNPVLPVFGAAVIVVRFPAVQIGTVPML